MRFLRVLILAVLALISASTVHAQSSGTLNQLSPWAITNNYIKAANTAYGLRIPGLATSTTGCLGVRSDGWISANGSACVSSGFPFTPLANYNATTTTIGWTGGTGLFTTGSSTLANNLFVGTTNVGIGTTTPTNTLGVNGYIDVSGLTGGYKFDGNKFIYASSTNFATVMGIGAGTRMDATSTITGNSVFGFEAMNATPDYNAVANGQNTAIGYQALRNATSSTRVTAIGYRALANLNDCQAAGAGGSTCQLTAVGYNALNANTIGYWNTAVGYNALALNTTGTQNNALGAGALGVNTTGGANQGIGFAALSANTTGNSNTAVGTQALQNNKTGSDNVSLGIYSLIQSRSGAANIGIGRFASGNNYSATSTVAIGYQAALGSYYNALGYTTVGYQAGFSIATSSNYNSYFGYQSGYDVTTGSENIFIGPEVNVGGSHTTTGGANICIAYNCILPGGATASNQMNIGNLIFATGMTATSSATTIPTITGNVGISSTSPATKLVVGGGMITGCETEQATTTSVTINLQGGVCNQIRFGIGTAATTINFSNPLPGMAFRLIVWNPPGASAGALTFGTTYPIMWPAHAIPAQTTTAKVKDIYSFVVTASSTATNGVEIDGAQSANF